MIIKKQIIWNLIGELDPNTFYQRIIKKYPEAKYHNPFNSSYMGTSFMGFSSFDGVRIENLITGKVIKNKDKDISNLNIKVSINAEIYHLGLAHIEHVYELDDWMEDSNNFEDIIAISDKDGSEFSTSGRSMKFVVWEVMNIEEVATLDDKESDFENNDYKKVNKIIYDKYGFKVTRIGTSIGPSAGSWRRDPAIIFDDEKIIEIDNEKDKKVSKDHNIYKLKDEEFYITHTKESFDKAYNDIKKDFIKIIFLRLHQSIVKTWLSEVKDKSEAILDSIGNKNEVYWQNLRTQIEQWQLNFLSYHATFHARLGEMILDLSNDEVFDKETYKKWDKEFNVNKDLTISSYNEIKYSLDNISTPGHTHDEQLLQHETEKVNERILLLSFLAMSIPMIGAILTPSLSVNLKLISGGIILLLPLLYISSRRFALVRNTNLNTKKYIESEANNLKEKLDKTDTIIDQLSNSKDLPDDLKATFIDFIKKSTKSQSEKLDRMNEKIKSL